MTNRLTIVGGTYLECCVDPPYEELYGSGLRAAAALSSVLPDQVILISLIGRSERQKAESICAAYEIGAKYVEQDATIVFEYYHPLSQPHIVRPSASSASPLDPVEENTILYYGMLESQPVIRGDYVVYDPQNHVGFRDTGCTANHLALILNKQEAILLAESSASADLAKIGSYLLDKESAEVVVIKNGPKGALCIDREGAAVIPVFETPHVWPIGSGDIFSAVFAWQWMFEQKRPAEAALLASQYTATYCNAPVFPLPAVPDDHRRAPATAAGIKTVYLAGPFFSPAERWLIHEVYFLLRQMGNEVFSPMHKVGYIPGSQVRAQATVIAEKDLRGLDASDVMLAVVDRLDAGTLFEIGYARSKGKRVTALCESVSDADLVMLAGTGCDIVTDLSTAIYHVSW
jgi:hypothetical protein